MKTILEFSPIIVSVGTLAIAIIGMKLKAGKQKVAVIEIRINDLERQVEDLNTRLHECEFAKKLVTAENIELMKTLVSLLR